MQSSENLNLLHVGDFSSFRKLQPIHASQDPVSHRPPMSIWWPDDWGMRLYTPTKEERMQTTIRIALDEMKRKNPDLFDLRKLAKELKVSERCRKKNARTIARLKIFVV